MKVAFYLQNKNISCVDCTEPLKGNPGIGGTEYLFIATTFALAQYASLHKLNYEIILVANNKNNLPENLQIIEASDESLPKVIQSNNIDVVVFRYSLENYDISQNLTKPTKVVMWAHNFISRSELTCLSKNIDVAAIICVGSEQLNMYRDHEAYYKSVVILNGYPIDYFIHNNIKEVLPFKDRKNEVTYLGNLVDFKGFHLLAAAWKEVIKEIPNAHLNVIGGAKLYDRNQRLGKYGLAEESYENRFLEYLKDSQGELLPSVTFHGVMGAEKKNILNKTKVGVPNPSGVSETFCISALELQLWGAVISTINYGGFKDTVYKTGILYDDVKKLAVSIITQLKSTTNDYKGLLEFVNKFDFNFIIQDWIILLSKIQSGESLENILKPKLIPQYKFSEINRLIKKKLPFGKFLPTTMFYKSVLYRLKIKF